MQRVEVATPDMVPVVRTVLARGLAQDPMMRWLFPGPSRPVGSGSDAEPGAGTDGEVAWRAGRVALYLGAQVEQLVPQGLCHVVVERGEVVAASVWQTTPRVPLRTLPSPPEVTALLLGERAAEVSSAFAGAREGFPPRVLPYLALLAVDPDRHSQGLGRLLLDAGHEALGRVTSLESCNPRNHSFYHRAGYRAVGSTSLAGGVELTAMVRGG